MPASTTRRKTRFTVRLNMLMTQEASEQSLAIATEIGSTRGEVARDLHEIGLRHVRDLAAQSGQDLSRAFLDAKLAARA